MSYKVSVVIPIYKVEKYLRRCINSVLNQTYSNIEIILVNDGSPDSCGEIADEYAERDKRIIVIHKENGGLSDARNSGLSYATGEYILFVDSDDWLDHQMIKKMMDICQHFKADAVQSAFYYAYDDYLLFDNRYYSQKHPPIILDNKSLMSELIINERVKNFAWGKLLKTNKIKDLPFEKGVLFEDVYWAHKVMKRMNSYVIVNQPMYFYYQRKDSIVSTYTAKNLDIIRGLQERHTFIERFYPELTEASYLGILKNCLIHYNLLAINRTKDKGAIHRKKLSNIINQNYQMLKDAVKNDKELKLQLYLFRIHPYLNITFLLIRKIFRYSNVISQPKRLERIQYIKKEI
ncbi:MAG: glycosyltransferase family 2 protein [Heyndrickxia sp.]